MAFGFEALGVPHPPTTSCSALAPLLTVRIRFPPHWRTHAGHPVVPPGQVSAVLNCCTRCSNVSITYSWSAVPFAAGTTAMPFCWLNPPCGGGSLPADQESAVAPAQVETAVVAL